MKPFILAALLALQVFHSGVHAAPSPGSSVDTPNIPRQDQEGSPHLESLRSAVRSTVTFNDILARQAAEQKAVNGCAKCTFQFCDQPTKNFRDQKTCKCGPCKGNKKPDPDTNASCRPDCQGNEVPNGPKDGDGDPTCKKCADGQKPNPERTDCIKDDDNKKCPQGQTQYGTDASGKALCKDGQDCQPGQKKEGDKCVNDREKKDQKMKEELDRRTKKWNDDKAQKDKDQKEKEEKQKRKARGGKCLLVTNLVLDPDVLKGTVDGVQGANIYDFSTGGFDQGFVDQDWQFDWPENIPFNENIDLDSDDFMQPWFDFVSKMAEINAPEKQCPCGPCSRTKRSNDAAEEYYAKHKRCPPKAKRDALSDDLIPAESDDPGTFDPTAPVPANNAVSAGERRSISSGPYVEDAPAIIPERGLSLSARSPLIPNALLPTPPPSPLRPSTALAVRASTNISPHKRQLQFIIAIFELIMNFAARAMTFIGRAVQAIGRIAQAFKNGERVLKVVKDGSKYTRDQMKNASGKIRENKNFERCLQGMSPI